MFTNNGYFKDAEGAGRYCVEAIKGERKYMRDYSPDVIYFLARWAFHWANLALKCEEKQKAEG